MNSCCEDVILSETLRGVRGIYEDFWEIEGCPTSPEDQWDRVPCKLLYMDDVATENRDLLLDAIDWYTANKAPHVIAFKGGEFEVFPLTGDGGFATFLLKVEDEERFLSLCSLQ